MPAVEWFAAATPIGAVSPGRAVRALLAITAAALCVPHAGAMADAPAKPATRVSSPDARDWHRLEGLSSHDRAVLKRQRETMAEFFRHHFGSPPHKSRSDLSAIQRALDAGLIRSKDTFELQALGVVLGDVMVAELGFDWVVYVDELGRSRALRRAENDTIVFPVTMISRRVEAGIPVDVEALFERARRIAAPDDASGES